MVKVVLYEEASRTHFYLMRRNPRYIPQRVTSMLARDRTLATFDSLFDSGMMRAYQLPSNRRQRFFLVSCSAPASIQKSEMSFAGLLRQRLALSFVQHCEATRDPEVLEMLKAFASGIASEEKEDNAPAPAPPRATTVTLPAFSSLLLEPQIE